MVYKHLKDAGKHLLDYGVGIGAFGVSLGSDIAYALGDLFHQDVSNTHDAIGALLAIPIGIATVKALRREREASNPNQEETPSVPNFFIGKTPIQPQTLQHLFDKAASPEDITRER